MDSEDVAAATTPLRRSSQPTRARVSPYPERIRSPALLVQDVPASASATALYHLVVQPIAKTSLGQRDNSGLEVFATSGSTFQGILRKLWDQFSPRVKGRAVRSDSEWSLEPVDFSQWAKVMQFKARRHMVDDSKSERLWNSWLVQLRGERVNLLLYEYGVAITKNSDHMALLASCVHPQNVDRAGATAETTLRDVVVQLQEKWGSEFQGESVVWRMWANHITRNQDRTTWASAILSPPPDVVQLTHVLNVI
ncbi:hypothetical protein LEN26_014850 [Aphanomyces euteiches]|nr:hypothetical protein LEN26_014850 [Aphanomyces euteiches]